MKHSIISSMSLVVMLTISINMQSLAQSDPLNLGVCRMNLTWNTTPAEQLTIIDQIAATGAQSLRISIDHENYEEVIDQIAHAQGHGMKVLGLITPRDPEYYIPKAPVFSNFRRLSDLDIDGFTSRIEEFFQLCNARGVVPDAIQVFNEIGTGFNGDVFEPPFLQVDYNTDWNDPTYRRLRTGFINAGRAMRRVDQLVDQYFNGGVFIMSAGFVSRAAFDNPLPDTKTRVLFHVVQNIWQGTHPESAPGAINYLQFVDGFGLHLYPGFLYEGTEQQVMETYTKPRVDAYLQYATDTLPLCISEWGIRKNAIQGLDIERQRYDFHRAFMDYVTNDQTVSYDWLMLFDFDRSTDYRVYDQGYLVSSEILGDYPDYVPKDTCSRITQQFEFMPRETNAQIQITENLSASGRVHTVLSSQNSGESVTFEFCQDQTGYYELQFTYLSSQTSGIFDVSLESVPGRWVPIGTVDMFGMESARLTRTLGPVYLEDGNYRIRFYNTGQDPNSGGFNGSFDMLNFLVTHDDQSCLQNPASRVVTIESEDATLAGGTEAVSCGNAFGGAHTAFRMNGASASFNFTVKEAGDYSLIIDYFSPDDRQCALEVNGVSQTISFPTSGRWCFQNGLPATLNVPVSLSAGSNQIRLVRTTAPPAVDRIAVGSLSDTDGDGVADACDGDNAMTKLRLTSMCSDDPATTRRWRIRNENDFSLEVWWSVVGTAQEDTLIVPTGDSFFFTNTIGGPNTTELYWKNENGQIKSTVKASGGATCSNPAARTSTDQIEEKQSVSSIEVYPNPSASSNLNVAIPSENDQLVTITLLDINGRVMISEEKAVIKGKNVVELKTSNVDLNGIYLLNVRLGDRTLQHKVLLTR